MDQGKPDKGILCEGFLKGDMNTVSDEYLYVQERALPVLDLDSELTQLASPLPKLIQCFIATT